jgi:hypothetical protein
MAVAAFAMPNRSIEPSTPLTSFVVPLEFLESVTGIEFFPGLIGEQGRVAVDAAAAGERQPCLLCVALARRKCNTLYIAHLWR